MSSSTEPRPRSRSRDVRRCERCGCDEGHACVDADLLPCYWVSRSLCSHCASQTPAWKPGMKIYQANWQMGNVALLVRQLILDRSSGLPRIATETAYALKWRPDLLLPPHCSARHEIAVSVLADCLRNDEYAARLHQAFMGECADLHQNWILNEFQIRQWVAARHGLRVEG